MTYHLIAENHEPMDGVEVGLERGSKQWAVALSLVVLIGSPLAAQARALNLGGSLQLTYSITTTDSEGSESEIMTFGQRYSLGAFGDLLRFGSYRADVSWFDEKLDTRSESGTTTTERESRLNILDYRFSANLFPTLSPLSLTAQQINRKNEVGVTTEETVNLFGANWVLNLRRFPRMVLNYQRSALDTQTEGAGGSDFTSQAATFQADGSIENTRIAMGYQLQETEIEVGGTSRAQGLNLNVSSQITPSLLATGTARYSTAQTPPSVTAPGVNLFQERSLGLAALYRPPLHWWDGSVGYNYSESPFLEDFKSHLLQGNTNLRPTDRVDANANLRLMRFTISDRQVDTEALGTAINYRPIFGLSTGLGATAALTSTENTTETDTLSQNYLYNINYFRPWRFLQYHAGYGLTYGLSDTRPDGPESQDLSNSLNVGVDNTNTRLVHVGSNAVVSHIQRTTDSEESDQTSYNINLSADSSYFRNLIRRGDSLTLKATANYSGNRGIGIEGPIVRFESTATYVWIGLFADTGYSIENYPDEVFLDRQRIFGQIQWTLYVIRNASINLRVKDTFEDNRFRDDVNRFEGDAQVTYQLGALSFSLQYRRVVTDVTGENESRTTSDSIFARVSRPF